MDAGGEKGPGRDQQRVSERRGPAYAAAQVLDHEPGRAPVRQK